MALKDIFNWNIKNEAPASSCGTACGASDEPTEEPAACGASDEPTEEPAACGASDEPTEEPSACGASDN